MFNQINDHAKDANLSFAEATRSLIGYAFDRLEDEERQAREPDLFDWSPSFQDTREKVLAPFTIVFDPVCGD